MKTAIYSTIFITMILMSPIKVWAQLIMSGETPKEIYFVKIEESQKDEYVGGMLAKGFGILLIDGMPLRDLFAEAHNISKTLVFGDIEMLEKRYDVGVKLPKNQEEVFNQVLQSALKEKFKLTGLYQKKEVEVYELSAPNGVSNELYISTSEKGKSSSDDGILSGTAKAINKAFTKKIEDILNVKVINETNLEGRYDYQLYWDSEKPVSIIEALEEQLGLVLTKVKKEQTVLIVE